MVEKKSHAALDKAFEESEEKYHVHSLEKPSFEAFKLQFEGLHSQVADKIPKAAAEDKPVKHVAEQPVHEVEKHLDPSGYRHTTHESE